MLNIEIHIKSKWFCNVLLENRQGGPLFKQKNGTSRFSKYSHKFTATIVFTNNNNIKMFPYSKHHRIYNLALLYKTI